MCGANPGDLVRVSAGFESVPRVRVAGVNMWLVYWQTELVDWLSDSFVVRPSNWWAGYRNNWQLEEWLIDSLASYLAVGRTGWPTALLTADSANGWLVLVTGHWNYSLNKLMCQLFPITAMLRHAWVEFLKIWMEFSILRVGFVNSSRDSEFPWEFYHIYGNKELQNVILFGMLHIRTILGFLCV